MVVLVYVLRYNLINEVVKDLIELVNVICLVVVIFKLFIYNKV